jgi:5-formyltetrahydrofolate cyclo-ligase
VADEKERMRSALIPRLRAISPERAQQAGLEIAGHLSRSLAWANTPELALFAALAGEVETSPIFEAARRAGIRTLLPRMTPGAMLEFVAVEGFERLRHGRYGVREPGPEKRAELLHPSAVVLVPGIAFDRQGGRLGRGAGYYDRALARAAGDSDGRFLVGVAFDLQIVERVPMSSHDVRMDAIVTEQGLAFTRGSG